MEKMKRAGFILVVAFAILVGFLAIVGVGGPVLEPSYLALVFHIVFVFGASIAIAVVSARGYLRSGSLNVALLGASLLISGLASTISIWALVPGIWPTLLINEAIAIGNIGILIGAFVQFLSAVVTWSAFGTTDVERRKAILVTIYFISLLSIAILVNLAALGLTPIFLTPAGPTPVRMVILVTSILLTLASSLLFDRRYVQTRSQVLYWYSLALALFGISLVCAAFTMKIGDIMNWVSRLALYLSGLYFFMALRTSEAADADLTERWVDAFGTDIGLNTLFSNMLNGVTYCKIVTDETGKPIDYVYLGVNDAFKRTNGVSVRDIVGMRATEVFPGIENDPADWIGVYGHVALTGEPVAFESRSKLTDRWYSVSVYSPRKGHFVSISQDITESKRAEVALRESEERLRHALDGAKAGMWVQCSNGEWFSSPQLNTLFGRPVDARPMGFEDFPSILHPEDLLRIREAWTYAIATSGPYEEEYRVIWPDGSVHWLASKGKITTDESSRRQFIGITLDITERKRAEEALQRTNEELQAVMDALPIGVVITDAHGGIVRTNGMDEKIWGSRPTTKGIEDYYEYKAWWADTGKPLAPEDWASAQVVLRGETVAGQVLEIQRFDGSHGFIINSAAPVRDADGKIIGSAVAIQDITTLQMAEEALREEQKHKLEFYQATIMAATNGKLIITERSEIEQIAGPTAATWEIHNPEDIRIIRHGVEEIAAVAMMDEARIGELLVCVGEAGQNVVKHAGNGKASLHKTDDSLIVVVSDSGHGIPALAVPDVALRRGYSTVGTLGMGYKIMIQFADRIYLATGPEGTTVGLEMYLHLAELQAGVGLMEKFGL
ncbi:MAG: PAS domain S-box protein [Armatimonadota bacterium]